MTFPNHNLIVNGDRKLIDYTLEISSEGRLQLSFDHTFDNDVLKRSMEELLPLLVAKAEAGAAFSNLAETTPLSRRRAMLAVDMKSSYLLHAAIQCAESVVGVATGEIAAAQLGFPEFDNNTEERLVD